MLTELLRRYRLQIIAAVFVLVLLGILYYVLSLRTMTVTYENVSKLEIYKSGSLEGKDNPKPVKTLKQSGQSVKLLRGDYTIHYEGTSGYDSKFITVSLDKDRRVNVNPDFSKEKQAEIAASDLASVVSVLSAKYPKTSLYTVKPGKILENGKWYIATMKYNGPDQNNADQLRAIFQKENGNWVLKTEPPTILVTKFAHPDIPASIVDAANDLP